MSDNEDSVIESAVRAVSGHASVVCIGSPKAVTSSEKQETFSITGLREFPQYVPTPPLPNAVWQFSSTDLLLGMACILAPIIITTCIVVIAGPLSPPAINTLDPLSHIAIKSILGTSTVAQFLQSHTHQSVALIYELGTVDLQALLLFPHLAEIIVARPLHMPMSLFGGIVGALTAMRRTSVLVS